MMTLQQAMQWVETSSLIGGASLAIKRVHTDTRSLQLGDLFVALKGDHFDAHDFLGQAKAKGAVAAIATHGLSAAGISGLEVADTKLALGQLAKGWRAQFDLPLIAVTGSNGKTTVTQMLASILSTYQPGRALATQGNFNNDIGLPLTLLRLTADHAIGVVELGMNHPGEIAYLADLARPTVALVNNAQREHLEFMGSVEAVAKENGAVIDALHSTGVAVFPSDDDYTSVWRAAAGQRTCLTFALAGEADVMADAHWDADCWCVLASTPQGPVDYRLHVAGLHNVKNSLAAMACALAAGIPPECIAVGLTAFEPVKGRSRATQIQYGGRSITLVDDTYNANPDSMRAAIDVLAALPGPRLLVMGDMGEVGDQGPVFHEEAGRYALLQGIEDLYTMGAQSALASKSFGQAQHFDTLEMLNASVLAKLPQIGSVLVKGSRYMQMERVVQAVTAQAQLKPAVQKEDQHAA